MTMMRNLLAAGGGFAALAAAAPAAAQYYPYSSYSQYSRPYGYASPYGVNTNLAAQQCTAAVQSRLYNRSSIGGIIGAFLGANTTGRVLSVTQVIPRGSTVTVRGLASSGRYAYNNYGPYGVGAYGGLGYNTAQSADLSFRCNVDFRGYVRNVHISRRY